MSIYYNVEGENMIRPITLSKSYPIYTNAMDISFPGSGDFNGVFHAIADQVGYRIPLPGVPIQCLNL
jgi:hypothetical protein